MLTPQDLLTGWAVYLGSAFGVVCSWWWMTRNIKSVELRMVLRLLVAVLFFMPYPLEPGSTLWAPALIMCLFDGMLEGPESMYRTGIPMLVALSGAVALSLLTTLVYRLVKRKPPEPSAPAEENARAALSQQSVQTEKEAANKKAARISRQSINATPKNASAN